MHFLDLIKDDLAEVESEIQRIISVEPKEVYGILPEFFKRGGKRIRPALVLLSCMAAGGNKKSAIRPAALIEIFHNFTLIHDDIEDNSMIRRGEPTLNNKYGVPIALNSGDALYTLLWEYLANLELDEGSKQKELEKMCAASFRRVVEGQGIELNWHKNGVFDITEQDYLRMVNGKTGALIGLSCELGGFLGGANSKTCSNLRKFGEKIGVAFQIYDDILNVEGSFDKYKKEICGDITEGKRTLMVIKTLEKATQPENIKLKKILSSATTKKDDFEYVTDLFNRYGGIDYSKNLSLKIVREAKDAIISLPSSDYKSALNQIAEFVISREA